MLELQSIIVIKLSDILRADSLASTAGSNLCSEARAWGDDCCASVSGARYFMTLWSVVIIAPYVLVSGVRGAVLAPRPWSLAALKANTALTRTTDCHGCGSEMIRARQHAAYKEQTLASTIT